MQQVTEQQILAMAPNANAASNGRKISSKGGFIRLEKSEDDTFYMGECKGSGKSNYITSVDFMDGTPLCRCSCPSRQFPCKHGLALLYEILAGKDFATCSIPEDILKKREKKQTRALKAREAAENPATKKKEASKSSKAAMAKKLKRQLEGLSLLGKMLKDILRPGLGTFGGTSISTYKGVSKQLGDYYLPGPQLLFNKLIYEMEAFQKDGSVAHYDEAILIMEKLETLTRKSEAYLDKKLGDGNIMQDDNMLYEELGGVWKLQELEALGRSRINASLVQLSFWITYDKPGARYIDTGCWADLSSGEIYMTYNYRPLKALKHIKQEDSVFGTAEVPVAAVYPGEGNLRVRWDTGHIRDVTEEDLNKIKGFAATSLETEVKDAKNILKNALSDNIYIRLVSFKQIGQCSKGLVLCTENGRTILMGDAPGMEPSCGKILLLPDRELLNNQVLLGAFYYDSNERRLKIQPLSIITGHDIARLLY